MFAKRIGWRFSIGLGEAEVPECEASLNCKIDRKMPVIRLTVLRVPLDIIQPGLRWGLAIGAQCLNVPAMHPRPGLRCR